MTRIVEDLLSFLWNIEEAIAVQNANDAASYYAFMHRLLEEDALAFYN